MGVLTFSLHSFTVPQRERLSSSNLSISQCVIKMGNPEMIYSNLFLKNSPPLRLHLRKQCTSHGFHLFCGAQMEAFPSLHPLKRQSVANSSLRRFDQPRPFHITTSQSYSSPLKAVINSETQETSNELIVENEKIGVLLLNLGGPETLEDVQPFLFNLFADPDIIRLPRLFRFLQNPLATFISISRAPKSKEGYASIGGGSPLRKITDAQAEELKKSLIEKDIPAKVYVGMRYWHPFTEEAIELIKRDQITKLVVLPLYPQFSISTSGSSLRLLENIFREDEYLATKMQHTVIPSWYQRKGYIIANANLIEMELQKFKFPDEVMIFFSAHGVPLAYVEEAGDPYKAEMEECVDLIMEELEHRHISNSYTLAYQSRVGPIEWLKPYTDQTIVDLAQRGIKSLLAVPISFVSEHIETLEEIDVEYKELALKSGIQEWGRVPALGCEPNFISDLANAVIESLPYVGAMAVSDLKARQAKSEVSELSTTIGRDEFKTIARKNKSSYAVMLVCELLVGRDIRVQVR